LQDGEAAKAVVAHIEKDGGEAFVFRADVAVQAEVEALVAAAVAKWGHLDVFVNNSAVSGTLTPIERETEAQVDLLTAINFKGTLWGIQAAAKVLQSGGSIINVSSRAATLAFPGFGVYAGLKSAVDTLTRTAAAELGPRGIRVNAVSPGLVETDMALGGTTEELRAMMRQQTPLEHRSGRPEEIADVVAFLASDEASWVTAQVITLAGGF
jgi:3-oxoacyl-[acyl-carrier protein] reductase